MTWWLPPAFEDAVRFRMWEMERAEGRRHTTVYRMFDSAGTLIYVGITHRLHQRIGNHANGREWWEEAISATFAHFATRAEALQEEAKAIREEHPKYNVAVPVAPLRLSTEEADERRRRQDAEREIKVMVAEIEEEIASQFPIRTEPFRTPVQEEYDDLLQRMAQRSGA